MDLSAYTDEALLLAAARSEVDARAVYLRLAGGVRNLMLRDRLTFLADEEEKHRAFLAIEYERRFPGRALVLPALSPVPLPEVRIGSADVPLSEVLGMAMEAERAAQDFYASLAEHFSDAPATSAMLRYFAAMEMGHYHLLEAERDNALRYEDYDVEWGMMHVGP